MDITELVREMILSVANHKKIDLLDIRSVQNYAIQHKMYELVVFINNNFSEYIEYVKSIN